MNTVWTKREFLDIMQQVRNDAAADRLDPTLSEEERARADKIFRNGSQRIGEYIPEVSADPGALIGPK